jgi:hypothetical protein
MVRSLI